MAKAIAGLIVLGARLRVCDGHDDGLASQPTDLESNVLAAIFYRSWAGEADPLRGRGAGFQGFGGCI